MEIKKAPQLPVIFLMGPTASGKTDAASALSDFLPIELVSVDAAQVYRGMDIGTAKPNQGFLKQYPHHLIDIRNPDQPYSAADFVADATQICIAIHQRGHIPLLVGGTMFYFSAFEKGLSDLPSANMDLRNEIARQLNEYGLDALYLELKQFDPILAEKISSKDSQRIQRAIEILRLTGQPPSEVMKLSASNGTQFPIIKMTLFMENRQHLHEMIALRFVKMLEMGLIEEVKTIVESIENVSDIASMKIVGYRQVLQFLNQQCDYDTMKETATAATRQLAKRQLTWLRQQSNVVWFQANHSRRNSAMMRFLNSAMILP